ncbi:MAG TPA: hypothetical protein VGP72_33295 [Planctomycetota bacterium]|jgi:hypothetical protein
MRYSGLLAGLSVLGLCVLLGCGGGAQWKVSVENKNAEPCSVAVTLGADSNSNANVEAKPGTSLTLIVGNSDTVVQTIKVTRGADVRTLTPKTPLAVGKECWIVISPDGTVTAATTK